MHFSKDDLKVILRDFGEVTYYFSLSIFIPLIVALIYGEGLKGLTPFILSGLMGLLFGYVIKKIFSTKTHTRETHAIASLALVWLVLPLIGGLPFTLSEKAGMSLIDSYFESTSALTTTGITIQLQKMPYSLIFWRALEGWIGGAGIIIMALAGLMYYAGGSNVKLFEAEASEFRLRPNIVNSLKQIWWIYASITLLGTILLISAHVPIFNSLSLSMSAVSTTGTEDYVGELAAMNSWVVEAILAFIMILGALPFAVHYHFIKKEYGSYFKDIQTRLLIVLSIIATIVILPKFILLYGPNALRFAYFHVVSAITAGGFNAVPFTNLDTSSKIVLSFLMFLGGAAGSTAGGIKLIRFWVVLKSFYWRIKKALLPPTAYFQKSIGKKQIEDKDIASATVFVIAYAMILLTSIFILTYTQNYSLTDIVFEVTSAQGNAGLTTGLAQPTMSSLAKIVLSFNMIAGRIEIFPLFALIGFMIKLKKR